MVDHATHRRSRVRWALPLLRVVYGLAWFLLFVLGSPWWIARSVLSKEFRVMVVGRLALDVPSLEPAPARGRILVHGVSVGEVKASQSLVAALLQEHEVVVSSSTDSGLKVARDLYPDLTVVRFPLDFLPLVSRFLGCIQPTALLLMELEVWPTFIHCSDRRGIPTAIVSGRITPASLANYQRFGPTLTHFDRISLFAAQSEVYAKRFRALGADPDRILVTGNVKVDGIRMELEQAPDGEQQSHQDLRRLLALDPKVPVLLAGSTHDTEDLTVTRAFAAAAPEARVILVPRHPPRVPSVVDALGRAGFQVQLLTDLRTGREQPDVSRPLVVDTIGELEVFYGICTLAFVGGTLVEHGGQNVLEPAAQGKPVLHGPSVSNFQQEAALLARAGASRLVHNGVELSKAVGELLADPNGAHAMGQAGREAVRSQQGATERTLEALVAFEILPPGRWSKA
ncbi:MAG TPA: 3-deoxy-D-manno-octulosonic acid transferase [Planctomycetes bacterium]|nr:3-deoxy-D-manno-octulosonic acid transferase [Planctomycetota bacterium]HIL36132.1 3-deoxy-D-manno-octulosonic acid transferase [Planctomycetota bacterium]